jgi:hypothetical protein
MTNDQPEGPFPGPQQPQPSAPYGYGYVPQQIYIQADGSNNSALAPVTSLVLGICSLMVAWIPFIGIVAWITAPIGLVFGVLGVRRGRAEHKLMSSFGIALSAVALLICFAYLAFFVTGFAVSTSGSSGP